MEYRNVFPKSKTEGSPIPGHLMLFQYGAKTAEKLRFYDRNPLCYIVAVEGNKFWGVNLHYYAPDDRETILEWLDESANPAALPRGYHKYLKSYVDTLFLDISMEEWETALNLGVEEFIRDLGSVEIAISNTKVWK